MNKKIWLSIGGIIVLGVAWYLISPLWRNVTLQEELPGTSSATINDNLATMDVATRADFEAQTNKMKVVIMEKDDAMPTGEPVVVSRADMVAAAHGVSGQALIVKSGNQNFLRFENLKTINGPDLRIYLSSGLSDDDIVDLGAIRATEGNVNYAIPAGTDLAKYNHAMIWCRTFGVLFSYSKF